MPRFRRLTAVPLSMVLVIGALLSAPAALGHEGTVIDMSNSYVYCDRPIDGPATGYITLSWDTPALRAPTNEWAWIAYGIYGAKGNFFSAERGWLGFVDLGGGNYWTAATTNGTRSHYSYAHQGYYQRFSANVAQDTGNSGANVWYIYALVWWPDGHKTAHWYGSTAFC